MISSINVMKSFASVEWVMIYNFIDRFDTVNEPESKKSEAKSCSLRPYAKKWIHFGFLSILYEWNGVFVVSSVTILLLALDSQLIDVLAFEFFDVKCPDSSFYFYELNVNVLNRNKMSQKRQEIRKSLQSKVSS